MAIAYNPKGGYGKSAAQPLSETEIKTRREAVSTVSFLATASRVVNTKTGDTAAHEIVPRYEDAALRAIDEGPIALLQNGSGERVVALAAYHWESVARKIVKDHPDWLALSGMKITQAISYPVKEDVYGTVRDIIKARHPGVLNMGGESSLLRSIFRMRR